LVLPIKIEFAIAVYWYYLPKILVKAWLQILQVRLINQKKKKMAKIEK